MSSSRMLCCVAVVRTDVSEDLSTSFIRVSRIVELGTKLAVTSNRRTLLVTEDVNSVSTAFIPIAIAGVDTHIRITHM
jgi:hypothetical protein